MITGLLTAGLAVVAALGLMWSLFAFMATDRCSPGGSECSDTLIAVAYLVAWGGIALASVVTFKGVCAAVARRRLAFIWPGVGLVIVVAGLVSGAMLLNTATGA